MINIIPWRIKNFLSEHFPIAYHLVVNRGTKGNNSEVWDRRLADNWDKAEWPTKVEMISNRVGREVQIVDIACGTGSILRELRRSGFKNLHGLDGSNYAIKRLTDEGFIMHYGKLPNLPFDNESFDVIIASQILEHVIRRRKFAKEIYRVLKPHGIAFIFVPNDSLGPIDEPSHTIKYTSKSLKSFLENFFDVEHMEILKEPGYEVNVLSAIVSKPL